MKFLQALGRVDDSSFFSFEFEHHESYEVCIGDSIWSDGHYIEIAEYVDEDDLAELINMVQNRTAFKGALRRVGLLKD